MVCGEIEEHLGHGNSTPDGDGGGEDGSVITARNHGHRWVELQIQHKTLPVLLNRGHDGAWEAGELPNARNHAAIEIMSKSI